MKCYMYSLKPHVEDVSFYDIIIIFENKQLIYRINLKKPEVIKGGPTWGILKDAFELSKTFNSKKELDEYLLSKYFEYFL